MKHKSLFSKSMLMIMFLVLVISIVIILVTQQGIQVYFKNDSYDILNNELEIFRNSVDKGYVGGFIRNTVIGQKLDAKLPQGLNVPALQKPNKNARSTIIIETKNGAYHVPGEAGVFIQFEKEKIKNNTEWPLHGSTNIQGETVFYAIDPIEDELLRGAVLEKDFKNLYYLAYISESYSSDLTYEVMVVFVTGLLVLISLIGLVLFVVFKKISYRLKGLEEGTQNIGRGNFDTVISSSPYDEIGRLGEAMGLMGQQLKLSHDVQAENFQMISHELKTPIMVMQGYLDALKNGLYPNGNKEATMIILEDELKKLENLTKDILFLNKTVYLSKNETKMAPLELGNLFKDVIQRLNQDDHIQFTIKGSYDLIGDAASWTRIIENILSNQMRYARSEIVIELGQQITIKNDGEPIPENILKHIDKPFVKGTKGKSGLGLTIVSNTLKLYDFHLNITNTQGGVVYTIQKQK